MARETTNTVRLGLFVIIAVVLFTIGLYNIGDKRNLFSSTFTINAVFKNVKGLQEGNNVRYAGINVGSVEEISVIDDTTIQINMQLEKSALEYLKKDAVASIGTDGLVGNMIVNINPGNGRGALIEDGDMLESYSSLETEEMLNALGSTTDNIALLTVHLLEVFDKINQGEGSVAMLINNKQLAQDLEMATRNLRLATENIQLLSMQMQKNVEHLSNGSGLLGYLLNDTTFKHDMQHITAGIDSLVHQRSEPILKNLQVSTDNIAATTADLQELIAGIDLQTGLAGTVLHDSIVAEDFRHTMSNLDEVMEKLNVNMEAMRHNFLFRKYFKKQAREEKKAERSKDKIADN